MREYFVHETACVDEPCSIGKGTKIWHFSHVLEGAQIGTHCILGQNVNVGGGVIIGNSCKIQNNVSIYDGVILEDEVFCGPSCVFTNVINPRAFLERKEEFRQTLVQKGASIGANATILCGVNLGRFCLVGAGALVVKNVPNHALVVGLPARQIAWVCWCGSTLDDALICPSCQKHYEKTEIGIEAVL